MARRDIVDLLREQCAKIECEGTCNFCEWREAAAEIERLRAQIARLLGTKQDAESEFAAAKESEFSSEDRK